MSDSQQDPSTVIGVGPDGSLVHRQTEPAVDDLAAWLTQIWDEDAVEAESDKYVDDVWWMNGPFEADFVKARIAADRQILARWQAARKRSDDWEDNHDDPVELEGIATGLRQALLIVASAHADRPGYQEAWKP